MRPKKAEEIVHDHWPLCGITGEHNRSALGQLVHNLWFIHFPLFSQAYDKLFCAEEDAKYSAQQAFRYICLIFYSGMYLVFESQVTIICIKWMQILN